MSSLDIQTRDEAVILRPNGGLIGGDLTEALESAIQDSMNGEYKRLIIDLKDVDHINSIGMATVIRAHAECRKRGIRFCMCGARDRIRAAFEVTRLTTLGILADTLEEALGGGSPT